MAVEVKAKDRCIPCSPRKVNLVASMVRGMRVQQAHDALTFCKKAVSRDVLKVLKAAVANARENNGLDADTLYVKEAYVGKSVTLRRFMPRAKGSGGTIRKTFSNLTIVLSEV